MEMAVSKQCDAVWDRRLKREDCDLTKHDPDFSQWKVLVGPSDWEDHSLGKEGAERYKVYNLPDCSSCSGLYELGIALPCTRSGREISKLFPDRIIPVYLGQSDDIRYRLQCYGREGAHLENGNSIGIFSNIFSRGCAIVYRWAPMKSKREAEKTEARRLDKFDYAWNKGNNGVRRDNDILDILDRSTSSNTQLLAIAKKLQNFHQKKIGIKIDACKPLLLENGSNIYTNQDSNDFPSHILKIGRSQPRLVSLSFGFNEDTSHICGVALSHGSVCRRPPVEGRKRCVEHRGTKTNGLTSKLITEGSFSICGITLNDGTLCRRQPVQGRKRCEEHKGRKIKGSSLSESVTEEKQRYVHGPVLGPSNDYGQISSESRKFHIPESPVLSKRSVINKNLDTICGVNFQDGTFCTRKPVVGRKRCEEHKWMRVNGSRSKLPVANLPSVFDSSGISSSSGQKHYNNSYQSVSYKGVVNESFSSTCGATLADGSSCRRPPTEGRKRCWQHKGMRENSASSYNFTSMYGGFSSDICGAPLRNGSICSRIPVHGRKRCEQHKGMRAAF